MDLSGLISYQEVPSQDLHRIVKSNGAAVDGSDMGVGKTYEAAAVIRELDLPTLVLCPKSSMSKWEKVAKDMGTEVTAINYEMARTNGWPGGQWVQDRGVDRYKWHPNVKCLVFDECHRCGGLDSLNSKMMIAARQQEIPSLALSATIAETPMRMKALAYLLGLYHGGTRRAIKRTKRGLIETVVPSAAVSGPFYRWARKYKCYDGWRGWDFYGDKTDMQRLHRELFPHKGVRIKIDDLGDQFPETQITPELVDFCAESKMDSLYREMASELQVLAERTKGENPEDELLQNLRQRQTVELLKVPTLIEMIMDLWSNDRSVALFTNFRATMEAVKARLPVPVIEIHGSQTAKQRAAGLELYQADEVRVAVVQNQAGGESIDMHDLHGNYPRATLINPPYSAWLTRQITGRVRRAGGKSKSIQRFLFAANTVEEKVYDAWKAKSFNIDALHDGDLDPLKYELHEKTA